MTLRAPGRFLSDDQGAGAVEFALVLPGVLFLLLGTINAFLMMYAWINLTSSAEQAARYAAVKYHASCTPPGGTSNCTDRTTTTFATAVSDYASSHYIGPTLTKTYTYSYTGACGSGGNTGNSVSASATYRVYYGFGAINFPLSGSACFP